MSGHIISFGFTSDWTKSVTSFLSQSCASCHMIDCYFTSDWTKSGMNSLSQSSASGHMIGFGFLIGLKVARVL